MKQHSGKKRYGLVLSLVVFFILVTSVAMAQMDVTEQVELKQIKIVYHKNTQTSVTRVGVKNSSENIFLAPIKVVIDNISPEGVEVLNPDGTLDGKPYLEYMPGNGELLSGQSTPMKKLTFFNPDNTNISYSLRVISSDDYSCGAYVSQGVWKEFDCYNLAAIGKTTGDDPFTPSWRLIGGYWQWGRKGPDPSVWYDTNTSNFAHGPTGPALSEANAGVISGWDQSYAPDGAWSDSAKTENDPCSEGFRVPTRTQWQAVLDNNTQSILGSWVNSATNYSSALLFGNDLMLPAAGERAFFENKLLTGRGSGGEYWSSSASVPDMTSDIFWFSSNNSGIYGFLIPRDGGRSIRCIAE